MAPKAKIVERLAGIVSEAKADEEIEQMKEDQKTEESAAEGAEQFKAVMLDFATIKARGDGTGKLLGVQQHNERNAVVLAVNHKPIACSESGGMSKQKMNEAKPLAMLEGTDLRLWSFQKASMAKEDRCDDISYTISPGDTFNIFMNATKYKDMRRMPEPNEHMLPMADEGTVIPATRRLPDDVSMHSVAPVLTRFPGTLNDALLQSSEKAVKFSCVSADLVKDKVAFFREKLNPCMMCENVELGDAGPGVRLTHWSLEATENINAIDIPSDVLLRACNAKSVEHAVALLQIAVAMEAVSLLITHNQFDARGGGSALRGMPFVNVAKMVGKFDLTKFGPLQANSKCRVNTGFEYFDGEGVGGQPIYLEVNVTPSYADANNLDLAPPSKDCILMMPGYSAAKLYECKVNLGANKDAEPPKEQVNDVLVFYLNAAKRSASAGLSTSGGKRKLCSMQWSA
ncbi:hypothetical protein T484DRAFT_1862512 [Baffinella frigidus]|nr:hypothetical protein T484DRAFT_1862512 [Cryptophyta sp. CCMP2293]